MLQEKFIIGSKTYNISIYPARGDNKKYPILILLHGNFGMGEPYGSRIRDFAECLAGRSNAVPVVGTEFVGLSYVTAVPEYYDSADTGDHTKEENPLPHVATLRAAIQHMVSQGYGDTNRIGLVGYSLGAAIAMTLIASSPTGQIKVLVDFFGPTKQRFPNGPVLPVISAGIASFPPTITFHDAKDLVVPVDRSTELHSLLPNTIDHELHVYTTEPVSSHNHVFQKDGYADISSRNLATDWVVKHLPPTAL